MLQAPEIRAELPDDDNAAIAALRQLQVLGHAQALPVLQRFDAQARDAGRRRVQGHAQCLLARCHGLAGDAPAAEAAAATALALFEALGDVGGQATAHNAMSMLRYTRGDYAGALELLLRALDLARPLGDPGVVCGLLNSLGTTLTSVGDPKAAAHAFEECMALLPPDPSDLRAIGVRYNLALALARWAERERDAGASPAVWQALADRAVGLAQSGMADAQALGNLPALSGQDALATALLVAGQAERALEVTLRPEVCAAERESPVDAVQLAQVRALALIALGRVPEAVAACTAALARAREAESEHHTDLLYLTLSQAHEAAGDHHAALAAHKQFHAARSRLVFERAERSARALIAQRDLERAHRESRVDPLTGIANRRGFEEHAQARLAGATAATALSLMLIDLDHFKQVNDTRGHAAGDHLLRTLADVLRASCRGTEPPARLGGDEFVVLVDGGLQEARALAQRVRDALSRVQSAGEQGASSTPACTASIGLAESIGSCALAELMARADRALYAVKHGGRNGIADARTR